MAGYDPSDLMIQVEPEKCIRCGQCVATCPRKLIASQSEDVPVAEDLALCIECGHCVAACEPGALRHSSVAPEETVAIGDLELTVDDLERFLRRRRSIRRFKKQAVEPEKLDRMLDIARYAPTGKNKQAVHHAVLTGDRIRRLEVATAGFYRMLIGRVESPITRPLVALRAGKKTLEELRWGLPDLKRDVAGVEQGKPTYCHGAPVVVVIHGETSSTMHEDCSYAAYHLMLAAETLGLGTCLIGYITAAATRLRAVSDVAEVPAGHQVYSTVAIGYSAEKFFRLVPRRPANVRRLS